MKLHLGSGTVYLEGYCNIDFIGKLASEYLELAEHNKTTVENYYKFPFRANKDNNVTDLHMDIRKLQYDDNSVDHILTVNTIDHITKNEFMDAVKDWKRVLKPGGTLIIDVDDRQKQAEMLVNAKTIEEIDWAMRLIYCDSAAPGRTHYWGYTPSYLKSILEEVGFKFIWHKTDYIVHDQYPNFQICVQK